MAEIEKIVNDVTDRTFEILKKVYSIRIEGQPTTWSESEEVGSRIIFPHYSTIHRDGEVRLSEQELRFVFVEQFSKYCTENNLHYYYSVETPTEYRYNFTERDNPKRDDDAGQSAMVDLAIHNENLERVALVEFKALNPDEFSFKKDFCKLGEEAEGQKQLCKLREEAEGQKQLQTFFIMFVKSANQRTIQSIHEKIKTKPDETVFRCFNLSNGEDLALQIFLPEGILDVFDVVNVKEEHTGIIEETGLERRIIHIHLDERDLRSKEWHDLHPNGFTEEHCINDFPIRDRKVVLHVRRRRWTDEEGKNVVLPHESLTASGTSYSKEFADVLKKIFGHIPDSGPLSGAIL